MAKVQEYGSFLHDNYWVEAHPIRNLVAAEYAKGLQKPVVEGYKLDLEGLNPHFFT